MQAKRSLFETLLLLLGRKYTFYSGAAKLVEYKPGAAEEIFATLQPETEINVKERGM